MQIPLIIVCLHKRSTHPRVYVFPMINPRTKGSFLRICSVKKPRVKGFKVQIIPPYLRSNIIHMGLGCVWKHTTKKVQVYLRGEPRYLNKNQLKNDIPLRIIITISFLFLGYLPSNNAYPCQIAMCVGWVTRVISSRYSIAFLIVKSSTYKLYAGLISNTPSRKQNPALTSHLCV